MNQVPRGHQVPQSDLWFAQMKYATRFDQAEPDTSRQTNHGEGRNVLVNVGVSSDLEVFAQSG